MSKDIKTKEFKELVEKFSSSNKINDITKRNYVKDKIMSNYAEYKQERRLAKFISISLARLELDQPPKVRTETNPNIVVSLSYLN
jgi:hypothetical protein